MKFLEQTPLDGAAIALHELYKSLMKAGFKKHEALYILATMAVLNNDD